ncbi:MAG: Cd(II)/Pb(II)-responsive transcriptional regulator [Burkholderiales bacterium]|nr:Cd(II)/Pb(II)-responsive transcriptional regulator [Burkholderiales bacterium]
MRIGELAQVTGTQVETIRYYEKQGLLPEPGRSDGNYRVYGPEHVELLQFIRHCRGLDMSLEEVRVLLRLRDAPAEDCGDVNALLDEHIGHVVRRIKELRTLERQLRDLRARCASETDAAHCGILSELAVAARATPAASSRERHLGGVHVPKRKG